MLGQISASAWKPQMVQDVIVPTLPVPASRKESLEAMRAQLQKTQREHMPPTFRQPEVWHGIILELPEAGPEMPRWRDAPPGASVQGNRAELAWSSQPSPIRSEYILETHAGDELARVSVEATGAMVVKAAPSVRGRYWAGIAQAAGHRFMWRLLSGEAIPATWRVEEDWREGRGQRVSMPLGLGAASRSNYSVALVDSLSGWALTGEIGTR